MAHGKHESQSAEKVGFFVRVAFVALMCVGSLLLFGESWVTLFVIGISTIFVLSELLVAMLPSRIRGDIQKNCIRLDGSWSRRREHAEMFALDKLRWDIRCMLALLLVPTFLGLWLFDRQVMPISLGIDSVLAFEMDGNKHRENLEVVEDSFNKEMSENLGFGDRTQHKQALRDFWPAIILGWMFWFAFCWYAIQACYIRELRELVKAISNRRWEYRLYDRAQSDEWSDQKPTRLKRQGSQPVVSELK